jgi:hypothetical protein
MEAPLYMTMGRRRGRPRSTTWIGKFSAFLDDFTIDRLAGELDLDPMQIYRWVRGDYAPRIDSAIAIVEVARAAGRDLSLEDVYERDVTRIRIRMRSPTSP